MQHADTPRVGTAGWTLPREWQGEFPAEGSHLQRYASRFGAVEIDSSFYRAHRRGTYERWGDSVPEEFRFAVKLPHAITHDQRLVACDVLLDVFLDEVRGLGDRLGPLLVQLPPSLSFNAGGAEAFFAELRLRHQGPVACEPRHASWFVQGADALMQAHEVARVAADPACVSAAAEPGGWRGFAYYRLHGSPKMYYSAYVPENLTRVAERLRGHASSGIPGWCIFDNTALGAATGDALETQRLVES
jgi:uncharacterized protein YecE (DUF72 family)